MPRLLALMLAVAVLIAHSGCASRMDPRHVRLPPPPTEAQRAQLGTVTIMAGPAGTVPIFTAPAKGAGAGALRGAGLGSGLTIAGGAVAGPYGVLLGILLAPVGAVVGSVVGAANAESAAQVEEKEAAIRKTMEELKIQETFRGCVMSAIHEQSPHTVLVPQESHDASTILEITVEKFGLDAPWSIDPPLIFVMTAHTRLVRASDGTEMYGDWLSYHGRPHPLGDWVAEEGALLREEAGRACSSLAERLVDEVFLLYLPGAVRSAR